MDGPVHDARNHRTSSIGSTWPWLTIFSYAELASVSALAGRPRSCIFDGGPGPAHPAPAISIFPEDDHAVLIQPVERLQDKRSSSLAGVRVVSPEPVAHVSHQLRGRL